MVKSGFYLEIPRRLDLAYAEHLYYEATNQRADKEKSFLSILRQSLKLGHAESGWVLINFARPGDFEQQAHGEKIDYLGYLIATALLQHEQASDELSTLLERASRADLTLIQSILGQYHLLEYDLTHWERLTQYHLDIENNLTDVSLSSQHDDKRGDGVPPC